MAETKIPAIYSVPAKLDPDLKRYLESVKEAIEVSLGRRGDVLDQAVTFRDLIDTDLAIASGTAGNYIVSPSPSPTPTPTTFQPPTPTGFRAVCHFTIIQLIWDIPNFAGFDVTEIYRNSINDPGSATRINTIKEYIYNDPVDYNETWYYWVRFISKSGAIGPFSSMASCTTKIDIGAVMDQLDETLANLPGYAALNSAIGASVEIIQASGVPDENTNRANGDDPLPGDIYINTATSQTYFRNAADNAWIEAADSSLVTLVGTTSFTGSEISAALAAAQVTIVSHTNSLSANVVSIGNLNTTVAAKVDVYRATTAPTGGTYVAGDLWFDTDDYHMYQWNGSAWVSARDQGLATSTELSGVSSTATNAYNTANSKVKIFSAANNLPTSPVSITIGDLWLNTSDGNKAYVAASVGANEIAAGEWVLASDDDIATAVALAGAKMKTFNQGRTTDGIPGTSGGGARGYANGASIIDEGDIWVDTDAYTTILKGGTFATSTVTIGAETIALTTAQYDALSLGDSLVYSNGGGTTLTPLTNNETYYVIKGSTPAIKLAVSHAHAIAGTAIDLTGTGNNAQSLTQSVSESNKIYIAQADGSDAIANDEWATRDNSNILSAYASVTSLSKTTADLAGNASASHVLQVNANGHVAGISLYSGTTASGQVSSDIILQADKILFTNSSGATPTAAFAVVGNDVFIRAAYIQTGTITSAHIENATIQDGDIANLSATKITAGTISTVTIKVGASTGARIDIDGANSRIVVIDAT